MAKVMIYEDDVDGALGRYEDLIGKHEVHIRLDGLGDKAVRDLVSFGFPEGNIRDELGDPSQESADVYFVDGLNGKCFDVLSKLPRDNSFLNSSNRDYQERAKREGYQILQRGVEPEEAIAKVMSAS